MVRPSRVITGTPATSCRSAVDRPIVSSTPDTGSAYRSSPTRAIRQRRTPRVTGRLMTKVVPTPCSARTSMVPLRSSTTVRTTSRPTPRPELWVTSAWVEKPGENRKCSRAGPVAVESTGSRPRSTATARTWSSSMPRPSSDTSITTVEPAARAETVTVACAGLPAWIRWAGVSQPWSTAFVTRCRSESATASSTRVSSSTSWPSRTSVTSLAVSSGVLGAASSRTSWGKPATTRRSGTIARPIAPSRTSASRL